MGKRNLVYFGSFQTSADVKTTDNFNLRGDILKEIIVGIYKITNLLNNKCYVGQSINIYRRWRAHRCANDAYPLHAAMKKYGVENFSFEILEECNVDKLNEKESYYIQKLQPEYNCDCGGNAHRVPQKLNSEKVNRIIQAIKNGYSHIDIANEFNISKDTVRDINVGRTWRQDNIEYPIRVNKFDGRRNKHRCPICGEIISYNKQLCFCCKQRNRYARYLKSKKHKRHVKRIVLNARKNILTQKACSKKKRVSMFSKEGDKLFSFNSLSEAANYLAEQNLCSKKSMSGVRGHISSVCKGKRKTAYGFVWKYDSL
mgnify:FL=1